MKKITLDYLQCYISGYEGLLRNGSNKYRCAAASDGVLAAHDILEHVNVASDIGSITDELEALGATWWIRGCFGDIRRDRTYVYRSADEILSDDICYMATFIADGVANIPPIRNTRVCDYDADFEQIIMLARNTFYEEGVVIRSDPANVDQYFNAAIHYLRTGYRKAVNRFKRLGQFGANSLFWTLAETIDVDLQYLCVGDTLDVRYCLTSGKVQTTIQYH